MEKKLLIMILGLFVFGFFLFGCASQQSQGNETQTRANDTTGPATMPCEEYCPTQPHVQCTGTWSISGAYPDCVCNYTCETQETPQENQSNVEPGASGVVPMSASIEMLNYKFTPDSTEVANGATVTWLNKDSAMHIVAADDGSFSSSYLTSGQTYSYTFTKAGIYTYHCGIHKTMIGTVIVK